MRECARGRPIVIRWPPGRPRGAVCFIRLFDNAGIREPCPAGVSFDRERASTAAARPIRCSDSSAAFVERRPVKAGRPLQQKARVRDAAGLAAPTLLAAPFPRPGKASARADAKPRPSLSFVEQLTSPVGPTRPLRPSSMQARASVGQQDSECQGVGTGWNCPGLFQGSELGLGRPADGLARDEPECGGKGVACSVQGVDRAGCARPGRHG